MLGGSRGDRQVASGEVQLLSDGEWESVITTKRGPGAMHALWPTELSSDLGMTQFDYVSVAGAYEVLYIGYAPQGTVTSAATWTIKKFAYVTLGGANYISQVQILVGVVWDDRAALPWV